MLVLTRPNFARGINPLDALYFRMDRIGKDLGGEGIAALETVDNFSDIQRGVYILADDLCTFESSLTNTADAQKPTFHEMPLALDYAVKAFARFWGNMPDPQDKTQHKANSVITEWIMEDSGRKISKTMAGNIAKIIRPEWAATGRTPEI